MGYECVSFGFPAGVSRLAAASAGLALARAAHVKPRTWRRYSAAQTAFGEFIKEAFPARAGVPEPPYDTGAAALWVGDMVARGVLSAATYVAGLSKAHVNAGGAPLRDNPAIQQALSGWARLKPPPVAKKPFTNAMLVAVRDQIDVQSLVGARDFAMLAVARGGAFRAQSELCEAQLPLRFVEGGAEVDVHTKTDKNVHATSVRRIPAAGPGGLSPLATLQHYLVLSGHTTGFVFRNVSGGGVRARSNAHGVSRGTFTNVVKSWAGRLGFDPAEFASHSTKHGCAADLKNANVPTAVATRVTGHASVRSYNGYGGAEAQRRSLAAQRREATEAYARGAAAQATLELEVWTAAC